MSASGNPSIIVDTNEVSYQFPAMKNDTLLRALRGKCTPSDRVPVWCMRQAGRYLPEFRAMRAEHDFFRVCQTPELACEITLQPIRRFDLDGAIIFSDILVVPQAMGLEVLMLPGIGPSFPAPLLSPEDMQARLRKSDVAVDLGYVGDALRLTRTKLEGKCPLLGFSGAPWTLMSYMIEGGGGSKTSWAKAKKWFYDFPEATRDLLQRISDVIVDYLVLQVESGAQALQLFDSWAGEVPPHLYDEFIIPTLVDIARRFKQRTRNCPLILFAKGAAERKSVQQLVGLADGYDAMSVDQFSDRVLVREAMGHSICLQGNLDPCALYASPDAIRKEVRKMLTGFGVGSASEFSSGVGGAYVANLGHGLSPDHNPEHVGAFIEAVHSISLELRKPLAQ